MSKNDSENSKHSYEYLQKLFRRQAQKKIDLTRERLDSRSDDSFANMQKNAYNKTMLALRQMGIYDKMDRLIHGKTQSDADALFDFYYNAYLQRSKGIEGYQSCKHILSKYGY